MPLLSFFFFLLLLLSLSSTLSHCILPPFHLRKLLHQPFFPTLPSSPPSLPPSPSFPKYPSSTSNPQPFFPSYPSPPSPPGSQSTPTLPANISSLIFPSSHSTPPSSSSSSSSSKLLPAILLPLLLLLSLSLLLAVLLHRRRRLSLRSDSQRLFPDTHKPSADGGGRAGVAGGGGAADFLYLGTLVTSRNQSSDLEASSPVIGSPYRKLAGSSPELHPLPPLSRQVRRQLGGGGGVDGCCSSDEEFYSPRGSSGEKGSSSPGFGSSSRRTFQASALLKVGQRTESSRSDSSPVTSPELSSSARSESVDPGFSAAPPPPPPPPPLRPLTPSPPKRKPLPHSPPLSPSENTSDPKLAPNPFPGPPDRRAPPPPPPPPPPSGYWENRVRSRPPPFILTPSTTRFKDAAPAAEEEGGENSAEGEKHGEENVKPKLKPLHWDKVRASSGRAMVWDQLKSSSFQLNEEMIETLFVCNAATPAPKEMNRRLVLPLPNQENRVFDPKKSQNIAILLRALNVTKEEVCEALLEGNADNLGAELLETLLKMAPSKEEEIKLKEYKDDSPFKLGPAEKFLKAVLDIPFAFKRVDAMLYIANFDSEVNFLKKSFEMLEAACEELRSSRLFLKLLEAVLKTGNRMNVGTNRGDAHAFKLDTLLKLVDVKGTDGKTTLLHFVVQEISRAEGSRLSSTSPTIKTQANTLRDDLEHKRLGLQVVSALGGELSNVKKAAAMDSDVLSSYVSKLAMGISKVGEVLRLNESLDAKEHCNKFNESMCEFLKNAEDEIIKVQAQESVALSLVKEITEYFHGNSAKEEAHPFRIFMVVRDFLAILDQVCKEVGRINEQTFISSARQFPVPVNPTLPPMFPRLNALRPESSDDESSSSSS